MLHTTTLNQLENRTLIELTNRAIKLTSLQFRKLIINKLTQINYKCSEIFINNVFKKRIDKFYSNNYSDKNIKDNKFVSFSRVKTCFVTYKTLLKTKTLL